ncbi:MAG: hypothetical protein HC828_12165 [Blastochloris sp.]|nr:hypothetical protein [Blastochloris sp.]
MLVEPANLARWQPTLQSVELLSGAVGQVGAVSRLVYQESERTIVMTETVLESHAPHVLCCRYVTTTMNATIRNTLTEQNPALTAWNVVQDLELSGLLKFVGPLLRPMIRAKFHADMARLQALTAAGTPTGGRS